MKDLSASIVIYKNPADVLAQAIHSFLSTTQEAKLYLIDNSPTDHLKYLAYSPRIVYIFNNKNIGFGAGHNIPLREVMNQSRYHLVLNPDVYFGSDIIEKLYAFMEGNQDIGQVMPKVLYPNGQLQNLCKLLPEPKTLIYAKVFKFLEKTA